MAVKLSKSSSPTTSTVSKVPPAWALTLIAILGTTCMAAIINYFTIAPRDAKANGTVEDSTQFDSAKRLPTDAPTSDSTSSDTLVLVKATTSNNVAATADAAKTATKVDNTPQDGTGDISDKDLLVDEEGQPITPPPRTVDLEEVEWLEQLLRSQEQASESDGSHQPTSDQPVATKP